MKLLFNALVVTILLSSCIQKPSEPELSPDHKWILEKSKAWNDYKYKAPNSIVRDEKKKETLDALKKYLTDTLNYFIRNVRVKVDEIRVIDMNSITAFYAEFSDKDRNQYYMEFDYPIVKKDSLENNPAYKLLKNIPEQQDTVLSFFYMGSAEWDRIFEDNFRIHVVPFPKDYNSDSARRANKK